MFYNTKIVSLDRLKPHTATIDGVERDCWNVSKVTDFSSMFASCLDLVNAEGIATWVVANATLENMFNGDTALLAVDVSGWDMMTAPSITGMFLNNKSIAKLRLGLKSRPHQYGHHQQPCRSWRGRWQVAARGRALVRQLQ